MNILAIWRLGRAYFSNLSDWRLQFGDAMLLFGQCQHVEGLRRDRDIIVLEEANDPDLRFDKAPVDSHSPVSGPRPASDWKNVRS